MNKRIKQLAKQSGFSTELSEAMTTRHNTASGLEKFAELLIQECMNICEEVMKKDNSALGCWSEIKRFRS